MMSHLPFLDPFLTAYVECALWSSCDDNQHPLDRNYRPENIAPETMTQMEKDCLKFYTENNLEELPDHQLRQAGHDFWLTRNGHGAGFWDGDWEEPRATLLTTASHAFGTFELYVGDDGKIYGTPSMCHDETTPKTTVET